MQAQRSNPSSYMFDTTSPVGHLSHQQSSHLPHPPSHMPQAHIGTLLPPMDAHQQESGDNAHGVSSIGMGLPHMQSHHAPQRQLTQHFIAHSSHGVQQQDQQGQRQQYPMLTNSRFNQRMQHPSPVIPQQQQQQQQQQQPYAATGLSGSRHSLPTTYPSNIGHARNSNAPYDPVGFGSDQHNQQAPSISSHPAQMTTVSAARGGSQGMSPFNMSDSVAPTQPYPSNRQSMQPTQQVGSSPHQPTPYQPIAQQHQPIPQDHLFLQSSVSEPLSSNNYSVTWTNSDGSHPVHPSQLQTRVAQPDAYFRSTQMQPHHIGQIQSHEPYQQRRGPQQRTTQDSKMPHNSHYSSGSRQSSHVPVASSTAPYQVAPSAARQAPPLTTRMTTTRTGGSSTKSRRRRSSSSGPPLPVHMRNPKKGRDRVFRPCLSCNEDNHIRRANCEKCKEPLPAGKRRKDGRQVISTSGGRASQSLNDAGNTVLDSSAQHHGLGQSLAQVQAQARANAQVHNQDMPNEQGHQHAQQAQQYLPQSLHQGLVDPQVGATEFGDTVVGSSHTMGTGSGVNQVNVGLSPVSGLASSLGSNAVVSNTPPGMGSTR